MGLACGSRLTFSVRQDSWDFKGFVVRRHDIATIWVAFFSRWQRYRCHQVTDYGAWEAIGGGKGFGSHGCDNPNARRDTCCKTTECAALRGLAAGLDQDGKARDSYIICPVPRRCDEHATIVAGQAAGRLRSRPSRASSLRGS